MNQALPKKLWDRLGLVSILEQDKPAWPHSLNRRIRNRMYGGN
jgi:hypothetical protein